MVTKAPFFSRLKIFAKKCLHKIRKIGQKLKFLLFLDIKNTMKLIASRAGSRRSRTGREDVQDEKTFQENLYEKFSIGNRFMIKNIFWGWLGFFSFFLAVSEPLAGHEVETGAVISQTSVSGESIAASGVTSPVCLAMLKRTEGEHPLIAPVRWAKAGAAQIESEIQDYSAILIKRERIHGVLGKEEHLFIKVRHEPFSVYIKFLKPRRQRGREAIYVEGQNDGNILAHGTGFEALLGTLSIHPASPQAMNGNRHPITELGILHLTKRLGREAEQQYHRNSFETHYSHCQLNGIECIRLEVLNTERFQEDPFHKAHIYVDIHRNIPIRYAAWGWETDENGEYQLLEEYTYLDIQLNQNFQDMDFDVANPEYRYRKGRD